MNNYKTETEFFSKLNDKVTLPSYQRRLVWKKKQKKDFIESISRGYPFGSLLLYKYENDDKYSIIDGLQRFSTLRDYKKNKSQYFKFDDYTDMICEIIYHETIDDMMLIPKKKEVQNVLIETYGDQEYHNQPYLLFDNLKNNSEIKGYLEEGHSRDIVTIQAKIEKALDNYIDLDKLELPIIEFTGAENDLANVFQRLNRGGVTLSKYQVYFAQWTKYLINLKEMEDKEIIDIIIERYNNLNDNRDGIYIEGYDEDSFRENCEITLAELCYALGIVILKNSKVFYGKELGLNSEDVANELGFSTMAIILNIPNKTMGNIMNYADKIDVQIVEKIFEYTKKIYQNINDEFESKFKRIGSDNEYVVKLANFQYLSYFANLWIIKHRDIDHEFSINEGYKSEYKLTLNNLKYYYIYELVDEYWKGSRDSTLDDIYINKNRRYLNKIDSRKLENKLIEWNNDEISKDNINFSAQVRILITFFYNALEVNFKSEKYDYEHIIPKDTIKKLRKNGYRLCGGSLGNCCFLDQYSNRSKGEHTIYQEFKRGEIHDVKKERLEELRYPSEKDLEFLDNSDFNKEKNDKATSLIKRRSGEIITELIKKIYL